MRTFEINGIRYIAKPFGFNVISDLDEMGINIEDAGKRQTSFVRAYFAICAGISKDEAGAEIEKHIIAGGNLDGLSEALAKEIEESDFFRKLSEKAEKEISKNQKKESK